jgi:hypothetical protein
MHWDTRFRAFLRAVRRGQAWAVSEKGHSVNRELPKIHHIVDRLRHRRSSQGQPGVKAFGMPVDAVAE